MQGGANTTHISDPAFDTGTVETDFPVILVTAHSGESLSERITALDDEAGVRFS